MDNRFRLLAAALALLLITRPAAADLIVNGNFEAGNTGFTSGYTYSAPSLDHPAQYIVMRNNLGIHSGLGLGDHTTGNGYFLAAFGATTPGMVVWSETVAVRPNTVYQFSAWTRDLLPLGRWQPTFLFDGTPVGWSVAPSAAGPWKQFSTSWNSGAAKALTIKIIDGNTNPTGNAFALDDLSLKPADAGPTLSIDPRPAPEPPSLVLFGLGAIGGLTLCARRRRGADR